MERFIHKVSVAWKTKKMKRLFNAVSANELQKVKKMIIHCHDLDLPDMTSKNHDTLLCVAIRVNSYPMCQLLLSHGASPNGSDSTLMPPLSIALRIDIKLELAEKRDYHDHAKVDSALLAAGRIRLDIVNSLLEMGADVNRALDAKYIGGRYKDFIDSSDSKQLGPDFDYMVNQMEVNFTYSGVTPLMDICGSKSRWMHPISGPQLIRTLLEAGADPGVTDSLGNTAIHYAAGCYNELTELCTKRSFCGFGKIYDHLLLPSCTEELIAAGSDVTLANTDGNTPLDLTINYLLVGTAWPEYQMSYFRNIRLLLQAGSCFPGNKRFNSNIFHRYSESHYHNFQYAGANQHRNELRDAYLQTMVTTALSGVRPSREEVTQIRDVFEEKNEFDDLQNLFNYLTDLSGACYSLKQSCIIQLRKVIRPPLVLTVGSAELALPPAFQDSILLKDALPF